MVQNVCLRNPTFGEFMKQKLTAGQEVWRLDFEDNPLKSTVVAAPEYGRIAIITGNDVANLDRESLYATEAEAIAAGIAAVIGAQEILQRRVLRLTTRLAEIATGGGKPGVDQS